MERLSKTVLGSFELSLILRTLLLVEIWNVQI